MIGENQNWVLFGYDVSRIGKSWAAAWREFLWGYDSPVKARLDEVVRVHSESGISYTQYGSEVAPDSVECDAVLLPDALVLARTLEFPVAVAADLDAVMAIEVGANSPFPADDTGCGWKVVDRTERFIRVNLAIVSLSATMSYLGREYDCHDVSAREVWADVQGSTIVLHGFGEKNRQERYRRRLLRVGALACCSAVLVVAMFAVAAGAKYLQLIQVRELSDSVRRDAAAASQARSSLIEANETIAAVSAIVDEYPNPHYELGRLTRLLGDDAHLTQLTMRGREIMLRGKSADAAGVMQELIDEPAYREVTAPQAITKIGAGQEQFYLDLTVGGKQAP